MRKWMYIAIIVGLVAVTAVVAVAISGNKPTPSPSVSLMPTLPVETPTVLTTPPPSAATPSQMITPLPSATPSQTITPAPSATPRVSEDPTPTPKPSGSATASPSVTGKAGTSPPAASNASFEEEVARLVNAERAKEGLSALTLNKALSDVARTKSQDMRDNSYFSHTSPTYGSPFDMLKTFDIAYKAAAENIAQGYATPAAVVEGWMNSPGHRANILGKSYGKIGVGYVASGHYWTQLFTD